MRKYRFSIRTMLIVTFVTATFLASLIALHRAGQRAFGLGPIYDVEEWPAALKKLVGDSPSLRDDVSVYALGNFIDHESLWLVKPGSPLIEKLFAENSMNAVSGSHPKATRLLRSIPLDWPKPDSAKCNWYATPGFGSQHIEGVDLFLVAREPPNGQCIVLHEWIF
jgi:hypothetical protein